MTSPIPRRGALLAAALLLALSACQQAQSHTPPPRTLGTELHCAKGDATEIQEGLGWGFCVPGTWRVLGGPRTQRTDVPKGVDTVYDITDFAPGPNNGLFGVIIISTDERGTAAGLKDWITQNVGPNLQLQPVSWANAVEAYQEIGGQHPRWFALTPHHVVILELHSGQGNLDLNAAMAPRLPTWRFTD